jgi:membrane protease YdiL (CAAX protease family)
MHSTASPNSPFVFAKVFGMSPLAQLRILVFLYLATIAWCYFEWTQTGVVFWHYPFVLTLFLAPLYEEIIFRGYLQPFLIKYSWVISGILQSSLIFGLWHFKNIIRLTSADLTQQMLYTGLIVWPLLGYLAYKTKTIRPGVIVHYLHNLGVGILVFFL